MGRVGQLAVILGVGGSVLFGVGCAVASADDTGTGGPSSTPSSASADKKPSKESAKKPPRDATRSDDSTKGDAKGDKRRHPTKKDSAPRAKDADASADAGEKSREPGTPDKTGGQTTETSEKAAAVHDSPCDSTANSVTRPAVRRGPLATKQPTTQAASTTATDEPDDVETVKPQAVVTRTPKFSSVVDKLLQPIGPGGPPESPAAQAQLVTSLAASRRELQRAVVAPDLTAKDAAPAAASLTYTAGPSLVDQVTVLGLRVLRAVSNVIGVDLFAEFNKVLISKSPPFFVNYGLDARKNDVELTDGTTWTVWQFTPTNPTDKTVVAVHGSGFIYEPNIMQWYDYTSMARDTGATVVVPLYPLATTQAGSALNVVPDMADFISRQIDEHGAENVSVYGDSAGSTVAISAVRQLVLAGKPVPSHMVLLSLTPDGSLSNPDIKNTDDPVIDVNHLGDYAKTHWADGIDDPKSPYFNPLYFDTLVGLPPTTIYVGSTEFILPDTLLLYQKALDEGAPISFVVGQGQIHDWPLGGLPINSQAPVVRPDIYRQLGLVAED